MDQRYVSLMLCWLTLAIGAITQLWAQPPNVSFEHLSVKDGLPSSTVYSINKDREGFMWFGTRRCPTRYDGSKFRSFLFPETYLVTGLAADSANRLWLSTDRQGLCRIDPSSLKLTPVPNTPLVTGHFFIDSKGEGWFGDHDGIGRINLRTGKVQRYPMRQTTYFGVKAYDFLEDHQHRLWVVGSDNGLFRFDRQTNRLVCVLGLDCPDAKRRFQIYLSRGCVGSDGLLWVGSYGKGLLRYDPNTDQLAQFRIPEPTNTITCVQEGADENGRRLLWIGDEHGLLVFRPEQSRFFRLKGLRPGTFFTHCLYRDSASGTLWVGTSDGILTYNPQDNLIRTVSLPAELVRQPVTVNIIKADRADARGETFWLGLSHTGLLRWHRPTNRFTLIRYPDPDESETRWLCQPDDGRVWIGLRCSNKAGNGVLVYDPAQNQFVANPAAKRAGRLFSVPYVDHGFVDAQHRLWVGNTDEGVRVLDSRTGEDLCYWPDSLAKRLHRNNNFLTDLTVDRTGRVWLATYQGLYYVAESAPYFRRADDQNPKAKQPDPAVNGLLMARNGTIWAARWGSVTQSRSDGKLLTTLTARDGLFDRESQRLAEDQTGTIWIGNAEGLHAYSPRTGRLWRLTVSDGLSQNSTTNALYVHRGTELFIGQPNGLNYLNTRQLGNLKVVPPVVISSFRVHEQERPINDTQPIRLARTDNAFSVDFSTLTYSRLPNTQYAYRLEGLDDQWNYSQTTHQAYYTNLGPGDYTLLIKAADSFGNWSQQPTLLAITIMPAYYETWWFRVGVILLVIGILYSLYRYRVNQLMRVQQIRNRISADLHDEIGSSLSSISILGTMANQTLPSGHPSGSMVERMVAEARQVSSSLDDIVWSINPRNDALSSLVARMQRFAAELFEASGIQYTIHIPDTVQQVKLSMEARQDFYLLFKEAINNLAKHARATRATVRIGVEHQHVQVEIADNGVGFDLTVERNRSGLRNMQTRAKKLNGRLFIQTARNQGTTLRLTFPIEL